MTFRSNMKPRPAVTPDATWPPLAGGWMSASAKQLAEVRRLAALLGADAVKHVEEQIARGDFNADACYELGKKLGARIQKAKKANAAG